MSLAGIFNTDSFSMQTLTASINQQPYVPGRLGKLGIFDEKGVATTTISVERKGTVLSLAPTLPRGAPGTSMTPDKRNAVVLGIPHIPVQDAILADEIQNVREFGTNDQMRGVESVRDDKLLKMSRTLDLTLEYHRLGAIQGIVLDSDGETVLLNAFTQFGISQPGDQSIGLATPYDTTTDAGPINTAITAVKRKIRDALGGDDPTHYWVACSDDLFDELRNHGETRATYLNQQAANALRENDPLDSFNYAGMTFENYRGKGSVKIPDGKAQIVPLGVPELFITRFAPAPWFSAVNTIGLPRYVLGTPDPTGEKRIDLEAQTNPINLCTRPEALFRFAA